MGSLLSIELHKSETNLSEIMDAKELSPDDFHRLLTIRDEYPDLDHAVLLFGFVMPCLLIVTIVTNSLVIMVLAQKHMRTPTNIVLFTMAIADTLTLLVPSPWYFYVYSLGNYNKLLYPPMACQLYDLMTDALPVYFHSLSIWLALLLASQRYVYVCHPATARTWCTVAKVKKAILAIMILALHQLVRCFDGHYVSIYVKNTVDGVTVYDYGCMFEHSSWVKFVGKDLYYASYFTFRVVFVLVIPIVSLCTLNWLLFKALRKAENKRSELFKNKHQFINAAASHSEARPSFLQLPLLRRRQKQLRTGSVSAKVKTLARRPVASISRVEVSKVVHSGVQTGEQFQRTNLQASGPISLTKRLCSKSAHNSGLANRYSNVTRQVVQDDTSNRGARSLGEGAKSQTTTSNSVTGASSSDQGRFENRDNINCDCEASCGPREENSANRSASDSNDSCSVTTSSHSRDEFRQNDAKSYQKSCRHDPNHRRIDSVARADIDQGDEIDSTVDADNYDDDDDDDDDERGDNDVIVSRDFDDLSHACAACNQRESSDCKHCAMDLMQNKRAISQCSSLMGPGTNTSATNEDYEDGSSDCHATTTTTHNASSSGNICEPCNTHRNCCKIATRETFELKAIPSSAGNSCSSVDKLPTEGSSNVKLDSALPYANNPSKVSSLCRFEQQHERQKLAKVDQEEKQVITDGPSKSRLLQQQQVAHEAETNISAVSCGPEHTEQPAFSTTILVGANNYGAMAARSMDSNRTTMMLIIVVTVFLIIEIPSTFVTLVHVTFNIISSIKGDGSIVESKFYDLLNIVSRYLKLLSNFFIMISYSINFAVYCSMSKKFRDTFSDLFRCRKQRVRRILSQYQSIVAKNSTFGDRIPRLHRKQTTGQGSGRISKDSKKQRQSTSRFNALIPDAVQVDLASSLSETDQSRCLMRQPQSSHKTSGDKSTEECEL